MGCNFDCLCDCIKQRLIGFLREVHHSLADSRHRLSPSRARAQGSCAALRLLCRVQEFRQHAPACDSNVFFWIYIRCTRRCHDIRARERGKERQDFSSRACSKPGFGIDFPVACHYAIAWIINGNCVLRLCDKLMACIIQHDSVLAVRRLQGAEMEQGGLRYYCRCGIWAHAAAEFSALAPLKWNTQDAPTAAGT